MEVVVVWLVVCVLIGVAASARGRSGVGWFVLSLLITPLLAGLILLLMPVLKDGPEKPTPWTHVKCPDCRELVYKDARKCKHCGVTLIPQ